jgi:hypothetical protein
LRSIEPGAVARLRLLAEGLGPAEAVTLTATTLRQLVAEVDELRERPAPIPPPDATVRDLAQRYHRSPARIREWIRDAEFGMPGIAEGPCLDGREWRVPWSAVVRRDEAKRNTQMAPPTDRGVSFPNGSGTGTTLLERQRRRRSTSS